MTGHLGSLSIILIRRFHLDLQERHAHPNGTTYSASLPIGNFHTATLRVHNAIVDDFGDRGVTDTLDTGITTPDEIEVEDRRSTHTGGVDLDEYLRTRRSSEELEDAQPIGENRSSGNPFLLGCKTSR